MCIRDRSYAVLVHPMGGSHHHIGGSVGSHLPEIRLRYRSMLKVGGPCTSAGAHGAWAPVSKHIMSRYGVLPWLWPPSKAWLVDPMIGLSRHVLDLTSPYPHVMQQHPQVGGSGGLQTHRIRAVGGGLWEVCIAPISMLPLLSHASWELSGRWCAAWHSLMTMVIFIMHQTRDHRSGPLSAQNESLKGLGPRGVVMVHGRKAREGQAHHMAGEPPRVVYQSCP